VVYCNRSNAVLQLEWSSEDCLFCDDSFSRLFTSDKPSKKLNASPALSYKSSTKQGTVRPVGDPNRSSREQMDVLTPRAFSFLQDDMYVYSCDL